MCQCLKPLHLCIPPGTMEVKTLSIHWHDNNLPIYSIDIHPDAKNRTWKLATAGGDNNVRIWQMKYPESLAVAVTYLSTLTKHTQAVNVVRFDPKGELLASAGDDGTMLLWRLSDTVVRDFDADPDDQAQESWVVKHACRNSSSEIYDLAWSPDSRYIIAGSMDNVTRIYNTQTGQCVKELAEHSHYVQGVTWDPKNEYLATQSADRSVHVYALNKSDGTGLDLQPTIFYRISKMDFPRPSRADRPSTPTTPKAKRLVTPTPSPKLNSDATLVSTTSDLSEVEHSMDPPPSNKKRKVSSSHPINRSVSPSPSALPAVRKADGPRSSLLYHNETLQSFFRRLTFSTDGSLLLTPSGIVKSVGSDNKEEITNTVYVYTRAGLNSPPAYHLPGLTKPAVAIRFSPIKYTLRPKSALSGLPISVTNLPYRMMFAVATQDAIVLYDTQQSQPLALVNNLHYSAFTDLAWLPDGKLLVASSADGFCSTIALKKDFLGVPWQDRQGKLGDAAEPKINPPD